MRVGIDEARDDAPSLTVDYAGPRTADRVEVAVAANPLQSFPRPR